MTRLHLHLLSDSTGETLENIAKAGIAQFENVEAVRHFWPMVRSEIHLDRIMEEISVNPGLVLFTLVTNDADSLLIDPSTKVPKFDLKVIKRAGLECVGRQGWIAGIYVY